jgi:thioredoxin-like negative regulator of GroEL
VARASERLILSVRVCLFLGLVYCTYLAARQGTAAWHFRRATPDEVQRAMQWDPGDPEYPDALATLLHHFADSGNPDEIMRLEETAVRLSPENADHWANLGAAYDWAGRRNDAQRAFVRALDLSPNSPQINWRLANFYVRSGKTVQALAALQKVLGEDAVPQRDVFALVVAATRDDAAILSLALPPRAAIYFDYLNFRMARGDVEAARHAWYHLLESGLPFRLPQAFPYLDGLILRHEVDSLEETWRALAARFPEQLGPRLPAQNRVVNGGFESDPLNAGLDWRVLPVEGAAMAVDAQEFDEGVRSLRINFDGTRNVNFWHVFQYVIAQSDTRYRFSASLRVKGITTDSGPRMEIYDAYDMGRLYLFTEGLTGTSGWRVEQLTFRTPRETRLLIVRIARPASRKFDNRIAGSVWIDRVSLEAEK